MLLVWLGAGTAQAQFNTGGWIRNDGWNFLLPLIQNGGCGGGGVARMAGDWIPPYHVPTNDPKAGNQHDGFSLPAIAFGPPAVSAWGAGSLNPNPIWASIAFLEGAFMLPPGTMPRNDVLDAQQIVDFVNTNIIPTLPGVVPFPGDEVMFYATTYVRNNTGAGLLVEICTASSDSLQVWVNNLLVTNISTCRGTDGGCSELRTAVLPTGISKITGAVWEGGGGWGLRLGIRLAGAASNLADGNGMIDFLGTGGAAVGQEQYTASASVPSRAFNCPPGQDESVEVTVQGSGPGTSGDILDVHATVSGLNSTALTVSDISDGGSVTGTTDILVSSGVNDAGFVQEYLLLGPIMNSGGAGPTDAFLQGVQIKSTSDPTIDETLASYKPGDGSLVPDNVLGIRANLTGAAINPGDGVDDFRWNRRSGANFDFNGYYGGDVGNNIVAVGFHMCLDAAKDVYFGVGSDDSFTIRVDGAVVGYRSISRDYGAPNEIQDLVGPVALTAGKHFVVFKVYEGGGGHGGRIGVFDAARTPLSGVSISVDPIAPTCELSATRSARHDKTITWNVTRAQLNAGLTFKIGYDITGSVRVYGDVQTPASGLLAIIDQIGQAFLAGQVDPDGPGGGFESSHDIGGPAAAGSTTWDGTTYTMTASGYDFWDDGDSGHFAYRAVTGDFVATMHVLKRVHPVANGQWGKHGVMARNTCDPSSKHSIAETNLQTGGIVSDPPRHHWRLNHLDNGSNRDSYQVHDGIFPTEGRLPTWLRLVRAGTAIYSYMSEDDGTGNPLRWCLVGSDVAPDRPATLLVGAALTAHTSGAGETGHIEFTFDCQPLVWPADVCRKGDPLAPVFDFAGIPDGTPASLQGAIVVAAASPPDCPTVYVPAILGERLRLTDETICGSANAVWFGTVGPWDFGVVVEFDAYMTKAGLPGDVNPADGMTFAVVEIAGSGNPLGPFPKDLDAASLNGGAGSGLAFDGGTLGARTECHPSIAIEMDNWVGGGEPGTDPADGGSTGFDGNWHIGADVNASVASVQTNATFGVPSRSLPNVFDPNGAHIEIRYSPNGHVRGYVSQNTAGGPDLATRIQVLEVSIPPLSGDVLFGFTGATGGATSTLEIDNLLGSAICCESPDSVSIDQGDGPLAAIEGDVVNLSATFTGDDAAVTYNWSVTGPATIVPADSTVAVTTTGVGTVVVSVSADDAPCADTPDPDSITVEVAPAGGNQVPGDTNQSGVTDISDSVGLLGYLFLGSPTVLPCDGGASHDPGNISLLDGNGSGVIDLADAVYELNFLFVGGPPPVLGKDCILIVDCRDGPCTP